MENKAFKVGNKVYDNNHKMTGKVKSLTSKTYRLGWLLLL